MKTQRELVLCALIHSFYVLAAGAGFVFIFVKGCGL